MTHELPIPQPKPHPLLGNLPDLNPEAPVQGFMRLARTHGPIFKLALAGREVIVVSSRELVNELCDEERFDKKLSMPLQNIRSFAGDGLFTAHTVEPNWATAHRILMPAFGPAAIREMYTPMLDIAEQMVLRWERFGSDEVIDVSDQMTRLTLDTIALCAFDYRFNSFYQNEMHPFVDAMVGALAESGARGRRLPLQNQLMLLTQRRYDENIQFMHKIADELIAERKKDPDGAQKQDLLARMLLGRDPVTGLGLSDENIRYQLVTFLIAGHETTSGMLSFALHLLLKHPQILQRARAEVDSVLGDRLPTVEDLAHLPYLDQILKETLRLWPTAPAFSLHAFDDTYIGGGYPIKASNTVMVLLPMLHRDSAVWGQDVERFDPERFTPEAYARLPENAWKPFGNGQRACIGRPFAIQEAMLVLALLLQRFELIAQDPAYQLKVKETLTLKPEGLYLRARSRGQRIRPARPAAAPPRPLKPTAAAEQPAGPLTPLLVLYGSNAGSAKAFAQRICSDAQAQGFVAELAALDEHVGQLPNQGAVLLVSASYEGQPPDNARQFVAWAESLEPGALAGVRFGVFGCGNRDWVRTYQAIPKRLDAALAAAGAERLLERGEADARGDFFGDFDTWYDGLWPSLAQAFGQAASPAKTGQGLAVEIVTETRAARLRETELRPGIVVENRELVAPPESASESPRRSKRHLEIELPAGMSYRAGDYLAVLPLNPAANVERALRRFGFDRETQLILHAPQSQTALPTGHPVHAAELLTSYLELSQPATRKQIETLMAQTPCPPEKMALGALLAEPAYQAEVLEKRLSLLDLLERTASCELGFGQFLTMLPILHARQYSISSSPLWNPGHCTLTVAVVDAPALSGQGRYLGTASTYLAQARPGDKLSVAVKPSNSAFHPPEALETPLLMLCAGTGIAPFRGFIQERALRAASLPAGQKPGKALLFFGCRHAEQDFLYANELRAWEQAGIVELRPAFSTQGDPIKYVQHRLWQDRDEVIGMFKAGARVFVCGDAQRLMPDLRETIAKMYAEATGADKAAADRWLADLEADHTRYYADVFA